MKLVVIGFVFVIAVWTFLYFIYLKYMKVSEKIWLRSFQLAGTTILIQVVSTLIMGFVGLGSFSMIPTAFIMANILMRVLFVKITQAFLASFLIVVVSQVALSNLLAVVVSSD